MYQENSHTWKRAGNLSTAKQTSSRATRRVGYRPGGYLCKLVSSSTLRGLDEDLIDGRPYNPNVITREDALIHRLTRATPEKVRR